MVRAWSLRSLPADAPRMPGVTMAKVGPQAARIVAISCGDATTPSSPALWARTASACTWPASGRSTPHSRSRSSSMLVSTVTAMTTGFSVPSRAAASAAACAAACIIGAPPEACTLIIQAPVRTAASTACATVLGMS
jgi:hypothetical protein